VKGVRPNRVFQIAEIADDVDAGAKIPRLARSSAPPHLSPACRSVIRRARNPGTAEFGANFGGGSFNSTIPARSGSVSPRMFSGDRINRRTGIAL
jgi:hypothetical protein